MSRPEVPDCQPCRLCNTRAAFFVSVSSGSYFRCPACDAICQWEAELPPLDAERAHYDTHENSPEDAGYRRFLSRLAEPLFARLPAAAKGLDYGCGPGPTLSVMAREAGFEMADYDPFFRPDKALLERRHDFVTCTEAVEHFHAPGSEFDRLAGLLKPGGFLGLMTELHDSAPDFQGWWYHRDPTHVIFLSSRTIDWLAARYGWNVEFHRRAVTIFRAAV